MDEVEVRSRKIETELNQEKIDYVNYAYNEEITYWKKQLWRGFQMRAKKKNWGISHLQEFC